MLGLHAVVLREVRHEPHGEQRAEVLVPVQDLGRVEVRQRRLVPRQLPPLERGFHRRERPRGAAGPRSGGPRPGEPGTARHRRRRRRWRRGRGGLGSWPPRRTGTAAGAHRDPGSRGRRRRPGPARATGARNEVRVRPSVALGDRPRRRRASSIPVEPHRQVGDDLGVRVSGRRARPRGRRTGTGRWRSGRQRPEVGPAPAASRRGWRPLPRRARWPARPRSPSRRGGSAAPPDPRGGPSSRAPRGPPGATGGTSPRPPGGGRAGSRLLDPLAVGVGGLVGALGEVGRGGERADLPGSRRSVRWYNSQTDARFSEFTPAQASETRGAGS